MMQINKYKATFIGLVTALLCVGIYLGVLIVPVLWIFPLIIIFSVLPFDYLGGLIFGGNNYPMIDTTVLFCECILLMVLCGMYFKKLKHSERRKEKFNTTRLIVFFVFLQFLIHPIGFYSWLVIDSVDQRDSMILFYIIDTFPYSGCAFIVFGIIIDVVRNRMSRKYVDNVNS